MERGVGRAEEGRELMVRGSGCGVGWIGAVRTRKRLRSGLLWLVDGVVEVIFTGGAGSGVREGVSMSHGVADWISGWGCGASSGNSRSHGLEEPVCCERELCFDVLKLEGGVGSGVGVSISHVEVLDMMSFSGVWSVL